MTVDGFNKLLSRRTEWLEILNQDEELGTFRRTVDVEFGFSDGDSYVGLAVTSLGIIFSSHPAVTLISSAATWEKLLSSRPEPMYHHFFATLMRVEGTKVLGDELSFFQHTHLIRRVLELARTVVDAPIERSANPIVNRNAITGFYVPAKIDGVELELYVERAGEGTQSPILFLHTAGADSRQAHPLISDSELIERHTVYSFDMPGHGRSEALPGPLGSWSLTAERYAESILAVIDALDVQRPILLGASMAGQACLMMACQAGDRLGGVIACEASDFVPGRFTPWAGDPRVNETIFVAEWIDGLIGPTAPEITRDYIRHVYSQGGHRTFAGDIEFYSGGWDGRSFVNLIDTSECPVVMMTGEYDYSCTPAMSEATSQKIVGSHYWTMPLLGHFPTSENPEAFKPHLDRALALIGDQRG